MKKVILFVALLAFYLTSCNSNASKQNAEMDHHDHEDGHEHAEMDHAADSDKTVVQESSTSTALLNAYLSIKDALVKDDQEAAGKAGTLLTASISSFDYSSFKEADQQALKEILEVAKENGEHISNNEIEHQRKHFEALGKNIKEIVAIAGTDRTLYQQYCPMYNEGGMWFSASNEIRNPLFGSKMLKCGSVQEEISVN